MFQKLGSALAGNQNLAWQTQFGDLAIAVEVAGDSLRTITVSNGAIAVSEGGTGAETFRLKASREAWAKFFAPVPPVGFQTVYGMFITFNLEISGDSLSFYRNLRSVEAIFAAGGLPERIVCPDDGSLCRYRHGGQAGAGAGEARGDGVLYRWSRRPASGAASWRRIPRRCRPAIRTLRRIAGTRGG